MALPLTYNIRNVFVRWLSTSFTIIGVALVVGVYVVLQAMAAGIQKSSANTGDPRNYLIVRKGSTAESSSQVTREQYKVIPYMEGIARDSQNRPLISADVIVLVTLPRRNDIGKPVNMIGRIWRYFNPPSTNSAGEANVSLRGISPLGKDLRPQVSLVEGRWFTPGKREVVVSRRLAKRFANFDIGGKFKTSGKELSVVGITDGGNSAFDSEIWMDADESRSIFDRENYSSVLVRVENPAAGKAIAERIENDKRLPLRAIPEIDYYKAQTLTAMPIRWLGNFLAVAMSVGAIFAAMNTMYASVGARTREIGTLRVLGYRRRSILASFLIEGGFLGLVGGALGCLISLLWNGYSVGTMSFETFSETVFSFQVTPFLIFKGLVFSVIVGVVGSFLPAMRAARLPVISALKSV